MPDEKTLVLLEPTHAYVWRCAVCNTRQLCDVKTLESKVVCYCCDCRFSVEFGELPENDHIHY